MLYNEHRPHQFKGVVGQDDVVNILKNQVKKGKVGHAYLFGGSSGTGKTTLARILAAALNCEGVRAGEPCGKCGECRAIQDGRHWDVIELDAASNRGIEDVRGLTTKAAYAPISRRKVYIIDEAHGLTAVAWDALLKTLEEPPDYLTWILCTTDPQNIPETVRSRCQGYPIRDVETREIVTVLERVAKSEKVSVEGAGLRFIAESGGQNVRQALTILEQVMSVNGRQVSTKKAKKAAQALALF